MKIKLDENMPHRLVAALARHGHDVDTVLDEQLKGFPDEAVWRAACDEQRFFITQDLDFSDMRIFKPGTHAGILLVRISDPGADALVAAVDAVASELERWRHCFVVLTGRKIRIHRP
jgi:predicted nuclease of predicted toxin-antitoxin system